MWCLVAQPNATKNADLVIEVRLSHKATGQECLNQVITVLINSYNNLNLVNVNLSHANQYYSILFEMTPCL